MFWIAESHGYTSLITGSFLCIMCCWWLRWQIRLFALNWWTARLATEGAEEVASWRQCSGVHSKRRDGAHSRVVCCRFRVGQGSHATVWVWVLSVTCCPCTRLTDLLAGLCLNNIGSFDTRWLSSCVSVSCWNYLVYVTRNFHVLFLLLLLLH